MDKKLTEISIGGIKVRARNIKPGFFKNEELAEIEPLGRILYEGLWCMADREGRLEDRPKKIKAEILPYDDCDIEKLLNTLQDHKFIIRYVVDGVGYISIPKFKTHQNPHKKEPASVIPPVPEQFEPSTGNSGTSTEKENTNTGISGIDPADSLIPDSGFLIPEKKIFVPTDDGTQSNLKSNESEIKEEYLKFAEYLAKWIKKNKPNARLPSSFKPWARVVRLMVEIDKRTLSEMKIVLDWAQSDAFWWKNILSMDKFRKQFDRLESEMSDRKVVQLNGTNKPNFNKDTRNQTADSERFNNRQLPITK